ncbi:MAG: mannose-6-phosphate isomerase [Flavobacteriaceae bacterium]|nr:mannose-6-phosphate isomerase [Flavobacteriaceae bacterium]
MSLYPLKFTPISKYRMWGGDKLNTVLNKQFDQQQVGESWEISDVKGEQTLVANGSLSGKTLKELISTYQSELVGTNVYDKFGADFPLLIKFIDAKTPLSIQVHPHDHIAKKRHDSFGKNEMWYIMDADDDAEIIVGFNKELTKESYAEQLQNETLLEVLNKEQTSAGDAFYIPTGRVHAIGAGVLLAEIQQTSDVTYRIYDYNRVDKATGKTRELHNDLALDVIDFAVHDSYKTKYDNKPNTSNQLIHTDYFRSNILTIDQSIKKDYSGIDSFVIYLCTDGALELITDQGSFSLKKGETLLLPASLNHLKITPSQESEILEVYM